jgi:hypothetical protein
MAKAPAKKTSATPKAAAPKAAVKKNSASPIDEIEKVSTTVLTKLKALNLDSQLQADIEWCLGSYRFDKNPVGLLEMGDRALEIFKAELAKKTKGITAKFITDLEKVIKPS